MELPKYIIKSTEGNNTSLGDNPCLPPEEERKFLTNLLVSYFDKISKQFEGKTKEELIEELNTLITKVREIEKNNIQSLQNICIECVNDLFKIPFDTINFECRIVNKIDNSNERLLPEKTVDFTFDSIDDMSYLTEEIYKRRVMDSLVLGASLYYPQNFKPYFMKIFEIEPELPSIYKKIMNINECLVYLIKDSLSKNEHTNDGGKVDVMITSVDDMVTIKSQGIIFPALLSETIKGILELAISHGLPQDRKKAMYVMSKADFKLAEMWDMRIGCPLWELIVNKIKNLGFDEEEIGVNFILMYLASMDTTDFNTNMKEIFGNTKKGSEILRNIIEDIEYNKEKDDFDDYMSVKNSETNIINDEEMFAPEELLTDSEF